MGNRLVVLTISIVYRGCAVPVTWKTCERPKNTRDDRGHAVGALSPVRSQGLTVIVLADRGLYTKWLLVTALG
ncbi:MAG: hypothetical protein R3F36_16750 [Candidatus Competibacteraceae bacterium]